MQKITNAEIEKYARKYRILRIVQDRAEGGFAAYFPELPGCITCGDTLLEALKNAEDAKRAWIAAVVEDGLTLPAPQNKKGKCK